MVPRLIDDIRGLGTATVVLHLGAHPDDEEGGMIAFVSQHYAARVVYWSATRGEGGQNRRGPERGEALGLVRTWESLEARAIDGGEVRYGPFYDFGFSKSGRDTLQHWGHDAVVREMIRAIRAVQPQVVVSRWSGTEQDGHGHHQAIGLAARAAYDAAGDPDRYPELGLPPWRPSKLYRSVAGDWQPGEDGTFGGAIEEYDAAGYLRIDAGAVDPLTGLSHQEQAQRALNRHRSQGMAFVPEPGPHYFYYRLEQSDVPTAQPERSFFDGLDTDLTGLAADDLSESLAVKNRLATLSAHASAAVDAFRPLEPDGAVDHLLPYLDELDGLVADLAGAGPDPATAALTLRLDGLRTRCHEVLAECLRLRVDCAVPSPYASAGDTVPVDVRFWNGGPEPVTVRGLDLVVPDGWDVVRTTTEADAAGFAVTVPPHEPPTTPYWLRAARGPFAYVWPPDDPGAVPGLGEALDPPAVTACARLEVRGRPVTLTAPAVRRDGIPGGDRALPLTVLPDVTVAPRERLAIIGCADDERLLTLDAQVRCLEPGGGEVAVGVVAPQGWAVEPRSVMVEFAGEGDARSVRFELRVPGGVEAGTHELHYRVGDGRDEAALEISPVRIGRTTGPADASACVREAHVVRPAAVTVRVVDVTFVSTLRYGYVRGLDESILAALSRFDIPISELTDADLQFGDLSAYAAIVVGPNAYNGRPAVRANADRLLAYAREGGTLIVQYQTYGYDDPALLPWPATFHQPHDRVTAAGAPVEVLEPDHPLLHAPNPISDADFDDWVHDRGLYFLGEWDRRYVPLLASHDLDEEPAPGGLLATSVGRGGYVYVAYSLFRQIPAGVPGAIRLFANLLGLADVRVRERAEHLAGVELFSDLSDEERYDAAKIVAERWVDAGTVLAREGERGSEMFILLSGRIEVLKQQAGREPRLLHVAEPGESIGELTLLAGIPRSASLRAATDAVVLVVRADAFVGWLDAQPGFSRRILARLAEKIVAKDATS